LRRATVGGQHSPACPAALIWERSWPFHSHLSRHNCSKNQSGRPDLNRRPLDPPESTHIPATRTILCFRRWSRAQASRREPQSAIMSAGCSHFVPSPSRIACSGSPAKRAPRAVDAPEHPAATFSPAPSQGPAACPTCGLRRPQCPAERLPASILSPAPATTAVSSARGLCASFVMNTRRYLS
jgi:hypothetical protein